MLLTPRIIRTHEYTARDLSPIYVGHESELRPDRPAAAHRGSARRARDGTRAWSRSARASRAAAGATCSYGAAGRNAGTVTPTHAAQPHAAPGRTARRSAGAARSDGADDDDPRAARADFGNRAGRRSTCRRRPVHGADLRQQRVARVDGDADGDVQPGRSSDEDGAGGQLPAPGRHERRLYAEYRRRQLAASTWRSCAPATRWAHRDRACWPRFNSTPLARARRSSTISGVLANPTGGTIPVQFVPASVVVR